MLTPHVDVGQFHLYPQVPEERPVMAGILCDLQHFATAEQSLHGRSSPVVPGEVSVQPRRVRQGHERQGRRQEDSLPHSSGTAFPHSSADIGPRAPDLRRSR